MMGFSAIKDVDEIARNLIGSCCFDILYAEITVGFKGQPSADAVSIAKPLSERYHNIYCIVMITRACLIE